MDFGTTNSGIAALNERGVQVARLDPNGANVMRSVFYMRRDGGIAFGSEAIAQYNGQNINRERRMVRKRVGTIEMTFAEIGTLVKDVFVEEDELEPGRLFRSLKSNLATDYTGTTAFGRYYRLEELIALYLRECRERAESTFGQAIHEVVMGRPVHFVDAVTAADDQRAENRLREAAAIAGFESVTFAFEPVAAAYSYTRHVTKPQTILVYDFGGGTLDLTVMKVRPGSAPEILSIGGVGIAGDRFDQAIIDHALLPHFGRGVTWGDQNLPLPNDLIEKVSHWETLAALATIETRSFLHNVQARCSIPARIYALESLIFNFYGFALSETVEQVKRKLSDSYFETLRFTGEDIDLWQLVTRTQFENYARTEWRKIREAVISTVTQSGLQPDQIDAVVRTGGSSSIPFGLKMLGDLFGVEKIVTEDLFAGVTSGLALMAAT